MSADTLNAVTLPAKAPRRRVDLAFAATIIFLVLVIGMAIMAPVLPIASYTAMSADRLVPPSAMHWFGTDQFGRDILSRVVFGLRTSLWIGGISVAGSTIVGAVVGLVAGYRGGWLDALLMRCLDALLAFPSLLLAIGVAAILGPGAVSTALALGIVGIPQMARIVRAGSLGEVQMQYVEAARSIGSPAPMILFRHLLPNLLHLIVVQMVLFFVVAVLTEASLSFLGLGIQVPLPSLGSMLKEARDYLREAPWFVLAPGAALTLTVLALNMLADGLHNRMDG
jgi:peptide/nickel transport system permease protein